MIPSRLPPARARAAFTLVELMLVVAVMGIMAAMIAPGLSEFLADTRQSSAAEDLVRLARHARARVDQTGRAHLMLFDGAASGGLGVVRVWEGMNNGCRTTPWKNAFDGAALSPPTHLPVDELNMAAYNPSGATAPKATDDDRHVIRLTVERGTETLTAFGLCFQPNGRALESGASVATGFDLTAVATFTAQRLPYRFVVTRSVNSQPRSVARQVLFPPGGSARLRL